MYERPSTIILELRKTDSVPEKETILEKVMRDESDASAIFVVGARMVLDPSIVFDIDDVPLAYHDSGGTLEEDWCKVKTMVDVISDKALTYSDAEQYIADTAYSVDDVDWNMFYGRILNKDLGCGIDVDTWNAVAERVNKRFIV